MTTVKVDHRDEKPKKFVGSRLKLYTAVLLVNLLYVSSGCVLTWSSPMLSNLLKKGIVTTSQASWIGSIMSLGAALGPILNSLFSSRIGRKNTLILNGFLFLGSWILLAVGTKYSYILAGRFIGGIATGFSFNSIPVYIAEIADDNIRQAANTSGEFFIGIGYTLEFCLGPFLPYTHIQIISALTVVIFIVPFLWMPESPYYLQMKGKDKEAVASLRWLRAGTTDQVSAEYSEIQGSMESVKSSINLLDLITKRGHRKAFLCSFLLLTVQLISGISVIVTFTELILATTKLPFSPAIGAMLFGIVNMVASIFTPPVVRKFGSKSLLISTSILMGISLELFAINSFLEDRGYFISTVCSIPVITLVAYNIFFCLGMGSIPWSMVAEISPPDFKGFISAFVSTYSWLGSFALMKAYTPVQEEFGTWPIFVFFGTGLLLGTSIVFCTLPDTKQMSLGEIQTVLYGSNKKTVGSDSK